VYNEQRAQDDERDHGGGAVCLEQPRLSGMQFRPEFAFGSMKVVQPRPGPRR
jgi:hypothetical protein